MVHWTPGGVSGRQPHLACVEGQDSPSVCIPGQVARPDTPGVTGCLTPPIQPSGKQYRSTEALPQQCTTLWSTLQSAALCDCGACANTRRQGLCSSAPLTNEGSVGACLFLETLAGGHAFETGAGLCCVKQAPRCARHNVQHLTDTSKRRQHLQGTTCVIPHADPCMHAFI